MHRKPILMSAVLVALLSATAFAQVKQFPYQARVVEDGVYVRSGVVNGEPYYPTQRLQQDTIVNVLRHDPGGWYQIEPPAGSFSWVPEEYVKRTGGDTGELTENNIVAYVGSEFGDETSVWQRRLRAGETVTILGRKDIDLTDGMKSMLKIAPPQREYRWIAGSAVVPVGDNVRQQHDSDPFRVPSNATRAARAEPTPGLESDPKPMVGPDTAPVRPSPQLARLQRIRKEQQQLREIDERFRNMLLSEPTEWKLDEIESDYRSLQNSATYEPLSGQIDLRYPAIERYKQRQAEYQDFERLTSATEKRDAQLLASQYGVPGSQTVIANSGGFESDQSAFVDSINSGLTLPSDFAADTGLAGEFVGDLQSGTFLPTQPQATSVSNSLPPFPDDSFLANPELTTAPAGGSGPSLNISAASRYIGAGILQRSADSKGDTEYVLATPSGRVLAHVAEKGDVNLEDYVGQSVGLHGSRWFRDDIKSDYIEVSGLEAVRIRK